MLGAGSLAIIPKARGMYARRITPAEYEEMLRRRTVPEVAALLKKHPFYEGNLVSLSTSERHRGQVEELLALDIFKKYEALLRYDFADDKFADFYLEECEVREILKVLHMLSIGMPGAYLNQVPPYLVGRSKIDFFSLGAARSFRGVVEVMRFTPYHRVLKSCFERDPALRDFPLTEAALLRMYYDDLFTSIHHSFTGPERDSVEGLFLQEVEIYNLELVHRVKTYFARSYTNAEIRRLLIPYYYRVPRRKLHAMAEAPSLEALTVLFRQSGAEKFVGPVTAEELDATGGRVLYHHAQRLLRLTTSPAAALAAFLTLVKLERDNVVNVVEGVRYGLEPEKIRGLLRH